MMKETLSRKNVELRGCERSRQFAEMIPATEEDYETEFLDLILAVKVVNDVKEARAYREILLTPLESILTQDYSNASTF